MIRYQYVLVNNSSQVSNEDQFPLLNSIEFASQEYEQTWPRISYIWGPYQLPPHTRSRLPLCYYYTIKLSFLERITPKCLPYLHALNKFQTVQSNTQYHMVHDIAGLVNALAVKCAYYKRYEFWLLITRNAT